MTEPLSASSESNSNLTESLNRQKSYTSASGVSIPPIPVYVVNGDPSPHSRGSDSGIFGGDDRNSQSSMNDIGSFEAGGSEKPRPHMRTGLFRYPAGMEPASVLFRQPRKDKRKINEFNIRYKKWLRNLQSENRDFDQQTEEYKQFLEEQKQRIREKQAAKRSEIRSNPSSEATSDSSSTLANSAVAPVGTRKKKSKKGKKPAWTKTEDQLAAEEDAEKDEMLDFAEQLDVDSLLEDEEVVGALSALQNRLMEIQIGKEEALAEKEKEEETADANTDTSGAEAKSLESKSPYPSPYVPKPGQSDDDAVSICSRTTNASMMSYMSRVQKQRKPKSADANPTDSQCESDPKQELLFLAAALLQANPSMRVVHSNASLSKVIEKIKTKKKSAEGSGGKDAVKLFDISEETAPKTDSIILPNPVIATVIERGAKASDANNLPYLHRNPAV